MAEFLTCNRLAELWMMIEQLHLSYLQTDESLHKIEQRNKLEGNSIFLISFTYHATSEICV
jgi:hypothetical protein